MHGENLKSKNICFPFNEFEWLLCINLRMETKEDVAWRLCGTSVARSNTNKLKTSPKYLQRRQQTS